jgi:hypothetical protein
VNVCCGHTCKNVAMYLASEVDIAIGVGMVELALMRAPF